MCLVQVGDQHFRRACSSGLFPEGGQLFKVFLQQDDEILVTVIDSGQQVKDKLIGVVRIPAERLVTTHDKQEITKRQSQSPRAPLRDICEIFEFPMMMNDVKHQVGGVVLVVRCRPCSLVDIDEAVKAGAMLDMASKPLTFPQSIISNKISVFDGNENLCAQRVYLKIVSARNLTYRSETQKICNPYCKGRVGEHRFQTSKCTATVEPDWSGETFEFDVLSRKDYLHIQVLDWDMLQMDRVIGYVKVSIGQVLCDTGGGNKRNGKGKSSDVFLPRTSNSSIDNSTKTSSSGSLGGASDRLLSDEVCNNKTACYKIFNSEE